MLVSSILEPLSRFYGINKQSKIFRLKEIQPPEHDECTVRREFLKDKRFFNIKYTNLYEELTNNPKVSYHEMIIKPINKMYFDIESP